jgi:hypothetical protein
VTVFRRRNRKADAAAETAADTTEGAATADLSTDAVPDTTPPLREAGPWDVADVPADGLERLDLGALRLPTFEGTEIRLEADEDGQITSVLLVQNDSAVQVGAFAAPRHDGIWDEIREEIRDGIRTEGGDPQEVDGPHGTELHAELDTPNGRQIVRFVGYDGPRWFLRGVFSGAAGADVDASPALDAALRGTVIVRGADPMPVRDPLPLRLPREVLAAQEEASETDQDAPRSAPSLPERGPEITETR